MNILDLFVLPVELFCKTNKIPLNVIALVSPKKVNSNMVKVYFKTGGKEHFISSNKAVTLFGILFFISNQVAKGLTLKTV